MSSLLPIIPTQEFEKIRDRIGEILFNEFADQEITPSIFVERTYPFDKNDLPSINITLTSGSQDQKDFGGTDETYRFNIDIYAKAKSDNANNSSIKSASELHKIIGVARQILRNPIYRTLLFAKPSLTRTTVVSFQIAEPEKKDAITMTMGRLLFDVSVVQGNQLKDSDTALEVFSKVTLEETDKGFQYFSR